MKRPTSGRRLALAVVFGGCVALAGLAAARPGGLFGLPSLPEFGRSLVARVIAPPGSRRSSTSGRSGGRSKSRALGHGP